MVSIKNFIWVFPVIGAIFGILTFLSPIMTLNLTTIYTLDIDYWIFGLTSYSYDNTFDVLEMAFTSNLQMFIVSIISSILIIVAVVFFLIAAFTNMRKVHYSKKFLIRTSIGVILLFVSGIVFLVGASWPTTPHSIDPLPVANVWILFNEGFGVYTPFIGGVIAIFGIPVHYYVLKIRSEKMARKEEISLKTKGFEERRIEKFTRREESSLKAKGFEEIIGSKKYIWAIPIIGAIFGIITFIAPAITLNNRLMSSINWNYWIWGLTSYSMISPDPYFYPSISETAFTNNTQLLTVSIISTVMISVAVIILLITGITSKRKIHYNKKFMTRTGFSAILLIVAGIIFYAGADWPTTPQTGSVPYDIGVWDYLFKEGFSVYSPFIGGGIALLGMSIHYILFKFRIDSSVKRRDVSLEIDGFKEKIEKIYTLEKETNEKLASLEETQNKILDQMVDLRKGEELENPPI